MSGTEPGAVVVPAAIVALWRDILAERDAAVERELAAAEAGDRETADQERRNITYADAKLSAYVSVYIDDAPAPADGGGR